MRLDIESLSAHYGAVCALHDVSFSVASGSVAAIIGANGAGKSTLLKSIVGWLQPSTGRILFDGEPVHGMSPEKRFDMGVALSPEGRRLFPGLTVEENLRMGLAGLKRARLRTARSLEDIYALFPRLAQRRRSLGRELSGGEQQMCAIGRALIGAPRMLLLDEPSLGLAPRVVAIMADAIAKIAASGVMIVLVEQNSRLALSLSDEVHVLDAGHLSLSGSSQALRDDPRIIDMYLGSSERSQQAKETTHA